LGEVDISSNPVKGIPEVQQTCPEISTADKRQTEKIVCSDFFSILKHI
jgi:hypothetical protein